MDEHEIEALGAPASPDALREIVAKHHRTRTRTLGILLAVALVAGPVAGWAIGNAGGGGQQVSTASKSGEADNATPAAAPAGGGVASAGAFGFGGPDAPKATHLFNRTTADGIAIRAYRTEPPAPPADAPTSTTTPVGNDETKALQAPCPQLPPGKPGQPSTAIARAESGSSASASANSGSTGSAGSAVDSSPGEVPPQPPATVINGTPPPCAPPMPPPCKATPSVLTEVSNEAAVGQGFDPIDDKQPGEPLSHLSVGMFGGVEGSPAMFVTVQTGTGVATARLRLPSGATDQMAPVNGVAVLAHGTPLPPPDGTVVEALDGSGKVIGSQPIAEPGGSTVTAVACAFAGGGAARTGPAPVPMPAPATPPTTP